VRRARQTDSVLCLFLCHLNRFIWNRNFLKVDRDSVAFLDMFSRCIFPFELAYFIFDNKGSSMAYSIFITNANENLPAKLTTVENVSQ
jgi:hypothetical protein